jgi:hypothetical protein
MDNESGTPIAKDEIDQLNQQAWERRVNDSTQSLVLSKKA